MPIVAVILGWPAVIASIVLVTVGIARVRSNLVLAGAFLGSPFLFYLFLTPRLRWVALPAAALLFGASRAVARGHTRMALAMAAPFVALAAVLAWLVVNQRSG